MKIVLYELNEISYKLFLDYSRKYKKSSMAKFLSEGVLLKTTCKDEGELHPWTSWPTLHMGVSAKKHNYRYLNQDKHTNDLYPPIWDLAVRDGFNIGIFGLLQSKINQKNKNKYKFFIPDTFNITEKCIPESLNSYQRLNTFFVSRLRSKKGSLGLEILKIFQKNIIDKNLSFKSIIKITTQLISELFNKSNSFYRTIVQHDISSFLFNKLLKRHKPDLAAFFTNHLAASMHRYLKYSDLNNKIFRIANIKKDAVLKGLNAADTEIGQLFNFAKNNGYEIALASSIGQEIIEPSFYESYLIYDFEKFIKKVSNDEYKVLLLPGMYPDYILKFEKRSELEKFLLKIKIIKTKDDQTIFGYQYLNSGELTINLKFVHHINIISNKNKSDSNTKISNHLFIDNILYKLDDLGIKVFKRGDASAYHIPEGVFCITNFSGKTKKIISSNMNTSDKIDIRIIPELILNLLKA